MTRQEIADLLINEAAPAMVERESLNDATRECLSLAIQDAATELRKTCATCRNWQDTYEQCPIGLSGAKRLPLDGSGFCHEWEPET